MHAGEGAKGRQSSTASVAGLVFQTLKAGSWYTGLRPAACGLKASRKGPEQVRIRAGPPPHEGMGRREGCALCIISDMYTDLTRWHPVLIFAHPYSSLQFLHSREFRI